MSQGGLYKHLYETQLIDQQDANVSFNKLNSTPKGSVDSAIDNGGHK